ncbi:MAG: sulfotransferase [candidate division Zixibacteria bacterium]|nr:sulfotransferase [candidate division Zixibacteria bacterium]
MGKTKKRRKLKHKRKTGAAINISDIQNLFQQAVFKHQSGQLQQAEQLYIRILKTIPDNTDVLNNLGIAQQGQGKLDEALDSFNRARRINPNDAETYNNIGNVFQAKDMPDEAIENYHHVLKIKPEHEKACNNLGLALLEQDKADEAVASFNRAININPGFADAYNNLGNVLKELGRLDEADDNYRKAIKVDPNFAKAYTNMAYIKKHADYNDDIRAMEDLIEKPELTDMQKMHLCFGLGKAFEDLHEYEKSFGFIKDGNKLKRSNYNYYISDDEKHFNRIINTFDERMFQQYSGSGCKDNTPIFIVGMPRSGTSLIEQILASHHDIYGAGELLYMGKIISGAGYKAEYGKFPDYLSNLNRDDLIRLGQDYVNHLRRHSSSAKHITDKMPHNFLHIGLIKLILPNAKIIHCRRDPMDTCFSCYKTHFTGALKFAYDMTELGQYYNLYQNLMAHWHKVMPGYILDVRYEDVINDQQSQTERMLDFLDLSWDDACLSFHKTKRPVRTASSVQVRNPIYSSSIKLWKHHEKQLEPLLKALSISKEKSMVIESSNQTADIEILS